MKNKLFAAICIISISTLINNNLKAQESKIRIGLKVAPGFTWIKSNTDGVSGGSKIGFAYGLISDFAFTDNYSFGTGIDVTYKGGTINTNGVSSKYDLQYIEVPLTIKMRTNVIGHLKYFGVFGVAAAVNINAKIDSKSSSSDINLFGAGLLIGGGLEIPINGSTAFVGGITFNNGFTDVSKNSSLKINTNILTLNLGILF